MRHAPAHRGLTLTELLVAVSLVGLITLAATNMELGSRQFFLLDRRRATLTNEGMVGVEHIAQRVRRSIWIHSTSFVPLISAELPVVLGGMLFLWADNADGNADDYSVRTPNDITDDRLVIYRFSNGQLLYNPSGAEEVIARYVDTANSGFTIDNGGPCFGTAFLTCGPTVRIQITTTLQGESITEISSASTRYRQMF